jgi:hypothetical protein
MEAKEFKLGDKVIVTSQVINHLGISMKVMKGIIVDFSSERSVGVQFDERFRGHDCAGTSETRNCWYLDPRDIELINYGVYEIFN